MKCQKYIARCYRVYQHERNENASFLSIFNGGERPKWWFSNFPRFWKNSSALGSFNCIFENNSLKALFEQNVKKLKILKLSPNFRYLQKLALKSKGQWSEIKWTDESLSRVDSSVHLIYHDPSDFGSLILIRIIPKERESLSFWNMLSNEAVLSWLIISLPWKVWTQGSFQK